MPKSSVNQWLTSQRRVVAVTIVGTLGCIAVAFLVDSFSLADGGWRWSEEPWNNVIIPSIIAPPVLYFLLTKMRALSIAHRRLEIVASTDSLTSCLNRMAFSTMVDAYLERCATSTDGRGAMLVIDVDHFKRINDSHGHQSGDEALQTIADAIRASLREIDLVGRLGGEEFSVFLPGAHEDQCAVVAERVRSAVEIATFVKDGKRWPLTVSVGAAALRTPTTFSELYRLADLHLYAAKRSGRNRVVVASSKAIPVAASLQ